MNAKDALKLSLTTTQQTLSMYVSDLSDDDLLVRPVPNANHIAWQLGHLIFAEKALLESELPGARYPDLPPALDYSSREPGGDFLKKAEYLEWFNRVRDATLANLDRLSDADLERATTGRMAKFAPTVAALLVLVANHTLMHAGQFTVVRRALNKPVLF